MTLFNSQDTLTKMVYDISSYGEDLHLPLGTPTQALQVLTWSTLDELLNVDADLENYSRLISDVDTLGLLNLGDGVQYTNTYNWLSDMAAFVYKFNLTLAVGIDVTAYTSGNHSVDSVNVVISERLQDGTLVKTIADMTKNTGMTALTAVGQSVAIMTFEGNVPFKIGKGNVVRMVITLGRTDTSTATSFDGILPLFYFQEDANTLPKQLIESTLSLHLHPSLDHAFPVVRDASVINKLDFSGVTKDGLNRAAI